MLTSLLPALLLLQQGAETKNYAIPNPHITVQMRLDRLEPAKLSPKVFENDQRWQFDWITWGFGDMGSPNGQQLRLRVYSQERRAEDTDKAPKVARMIMQLWDRAYRRLKINHPEDVNSGIVDFFLCFGGSPGGEQLFTTEIVGNQSRPVKVNNIYIYRLDSFKDPVEMAREVAHEYGHAVLPPIGGFKQPERWGGGYLGEKLFLKWIRDEMATGTLKPEDVMDASYAGINSWVSNNVDKLVIKAATQFPDANLINEAKGGMEAFNGLAMYIEALCPPAVFRRSLEYTRDAHRTNGDMTPPTDYATHILTAVGEVENLTLSVPKALMEKKSIWIPLGKGTLSGATILSRRDGWAQVAPLMPNIVIKNKPIG